MLRHKKLWLKLKNSYLYEKLHNIKKKLIENIFL